MSRSERLITALALVSGFFALLPLAWSMLPDTTIQQAVSQQLASHGIAMQAGTCTTGFPFRIIARNVTLRDAVDQKPLLVIDQLSIRLRLLPLVLGKATCTATGQIGAGLLSATVTIYPALRGELHLSGLPLDALPVLTSTLTGTVKGTALLEMRFTQQQGITVGEARLRIADLQLAQARLAALALPDLTIPETRGLLKLQGDTITVSSLALQGDGIYLRLTGTLPLNPSAPLSLALELLPTTELFERNRSLFLLMTPYQTAPGAFKLPIGGSLSSPQLLSRSGA
jgi:type II secretion system protein N